MQFDDEDVIIESDTENNKLQEEETKPSLDNWMEFQDGHENNKSEGPEVDNNIKDEEEDAAQDYLERLVGISHAKVTGYPIDNNETRLDTNIPPEVGQPAVSD